MTAQDLEYIELVAERAAAKAVEKSQAYVDNAIKAHHEQCLKDAERDKLKMGMKALTALILAGGAAGAFGAGIKTAVLTYLQK